jgi:hypothetical protein
MCDIRPTGCRTRTSGLSDYRAVTPVPPIVYRSNVITISLDLVLGLLVMLVVVDLGLLEVYSLGPVDSSRSNVRLVKVNKL